MAKKDIDNLSENISNVTVATYNDFESKIASSILYNTINTAIRNLEEDSVLKIKDLIIEMKLEKTPSEEITKAKELQTKLVVSLEQIKLERLMMYQKIPYTVLKKAIEEKTKYIQSLKNRAGTLEFFKREYKEAQLLHDPLLQAAKKINKEAEAKKLIASMKYEAQKKVHNSWDAFKTWVEKNKIEKLSTTKFANEKELNKAMIKVERFISGSAPVTLLKNSADIKKLIAQLHTKVATIKQKTSEKKLDECWNNAINYAYENKEGALIKFKMFLDFLKNIRPFSGKKDIQGKDQPLIEQVKSGYIWGSVQKVKSAVSSATNFVTSGATKVGSLVRQATSIVLNAPALIKKYAEITANFKAVMNSFSSCSSAVFDKTTTDAYLIKKMVHDPSPEQKAKELNMASQKKYNDLVMKIKNNELSQKANTEAIVEAKKEIISEDKKKAIVEAKKEKPKKSELKDILEEFRKQLTKGTEKFVTEQKEATAKMKEKGFKKIEELEKREKELKKENKGFWSTIGELLGVNKYDDLFDDDLFDEPEKEQQRQEGQQE